MSIVSYAAGLTNMILGKNSGNSATDWLKKYRIKTFIDIGAYIGEYVDFALSAFPDADIYAYEPLTESYRILVSKFAENKKVNVYNVAVGNKTATGRMYKSSYAPSSSLLRMAQTHKNAFPESAGESVEKIKVCTLDNLFKGKKIAEDIFIKVDTQGYEDKVIDGGKSIFSTAKIIQIEVSFEELYKNQVMFDGIYSRLTELGFFYHGNKNQILSPLDGTILQAHAYFIRA